jgi:tetratricopeptide (TPR) repeat protein
MSTVALSMIVKDEVEAVESLVRDALPYFNQVNLVVSDKPSANKLKKLAEELNRQAPEGRSVNVKWREWNNRFDEARNVAMGMCTTDFFFWLDADDSFDFKAIPQLKAIADENNIDAIFLPYNYAQDERGNSITRHWRERLVRLGRGYEWRGWVHETCITDDPKAITHKVEAEVTHHNSPEHARASYERNHAILAVAYDETKDPRYLHYLGMSFFTRKEYDKAAELLSEYLKVGGSVEDTYRSLGILSECAYFLGQLDLALEYAAKCATLKPEYPMAYWLLAQYEADQDQYAEALEWVKVSESKPDPDTLSVWDPTSRERARIIAARSLFMQGKYNEALAWLRKVPKDNTDVQKVYDDFLEQADLETFIAMLPKMSKFFDDKWALWKSLRRDVKYDTRLQSLRHATNRPKKWNDKSIVIFCGQGYEEWGPHTLDKGMGGSEEAVIYLSRELSKLGYEVTVFGEVDHPVAHYYDPESMHNHVSYVPWKEIDVRDEFNVFVSWRAPQYIEKIKAKVKLVDVHDVLPKEIVKDFPDVTYMVKSQYHSDLLPEDVDRKVVGNGIDKEQFAE